MKRKYECEKCGLLFESDYECIRHERECVGDYVDKLNAMSDEKYDAMVRAYAEAGYSNITSEAVNV